MNNTNLEQKNQSANPALDLQRNQGMIFARRRHHPSHDDHSNSSVSIFCTFKGGLLNGWHL